MPNPNFTFAFIIATLIGAVFHLIIGGGARRLTFFLLASWIGFALGQVLGVSLNISVMRIGDLYLGTAAGGALFALLVAYVFTSDRTRGQTSR